MLITIDIGNTNIVWGIFEKEDLKGNWRFSADHAKTSDEYGILIADLLHLYHFSPESITDVIISSVVPSLTPVFTATVQELFHCTPIIVHPDIPSGLHIRIRNKEELGSDRLVNAAGAFARYQCPLIIIDFGTATTFCAVTGKGEYLGGAIAPGLGISAEALFSRTAKLPNVDILRPNSAIGTDTVSSIQSGLVFGYTGLVDSMVRRIQKELGEEAWVIATGGLAPLIAQESQVVQEIRPYLTLEGLEWLYRHGKQSSP